MPRYDYECPECGHIFELKQSFDDEPIAECPRCQSPSRRIFSPVPIIFKGSGFYITDHRKDAKPSTSTSPAPRPDAKTPPTATKDKKSDTAAADASGDKP